MLLRSRHRFNKEKKRLGHDLNPMSQPDNEQTNYSSRNMKKGVVTKNQWLTIEMVSRHAFEVATQNAVESNTARSQHEIEVATYTSTKGRTVRSRQEIVVATSATRNKRKLSQPESSLLDTDMVMTQQSNSRLQIDDSQEKLLSK